MSTLGVLVGLGRCQVRGQCVVVAPEAPRLRGEEMLEFDPSLEDERRDEILAAAVSVILLPNAGFDEPRVRW